MNTFYKALLTTVAMSVPGAIVIALLVAVGVPQWFAMVVCVGLVVATGLYVLRNGEGWDP